MPENPELSIFGCWSQIAQQPARSRDVVVGLGHEVVARSIEVDEVAAVTRRRTARCGTGRPGRQQVAATGL